MIVTCEEVRHSLGVYVLGAIEPAERVQVDLHVGSCPGCRDELAAMAGMPALLGRVSENQIAEIAGPPEELLDSLLSRAAAERSRARRGLRGIGRWGPLAVAAATLLIMGALFGGMLAEGSEGTSGAQPRPSTSVAPSIKPTPTEMPTEMPTEPTESPKKGRPGPPSEKLTARNARNGVAARLEVFKQAWGTVAELHLKGVPVGTRCRLVAVTMDGWRDAMGSWQVAKQYKAFYGSSMYMRDRLASFQIVTEDSQVLLTIPA